MSGGYFAYDFLCMMVLGVLSWDMAIHHGLCVAGIVVVLMNDNGCGFVVTGLFVAEVSNPPMHFRILLRHMGMRYTKSYEVAEYAYFGMFFVGRMILGHPAVYNTVVCDQVDFLPKFVSVGILLQSY